MYPIFLSSTKQGITLSFFLTCPTLLQLVSSDVKIQNKIFIDDDRDSNNLQLPGQLIHHVTSGPKIWRVYSRRGKKVKSG